MSKVIYSQLETVAIDSGERNEIARLRGIYEAPNWSRDGRYWVLNHEGRLVKIDAQSAELSSIDTDFAVRCNNDHGISPDGSHLVISHHQQDCGGGSIIYLLPITGGVPRRITAHGPSYWHGWSPDGETLAYVAGRQGNDYKIYSIPVNGGEETQLSFGPGLDDGPDYSHDGRYIYFNRFQQQKMQIWRMDNDGGNPQQLLDSNHSDWFPHPSPDGRHLVFLRYIADQGQTHPFGRDVQLMLVDLTTHQLTPLTDIFYGGQGTINVPSWSSDGRQLAFISYQQLVETP